MKTPLLLLPFLLFVAAASTAQHQFYYRDIFDKNNGLTAGPTCMVEDDEGFFWIGTAKGLFRFDGGRAWEIKFAPDDSLADKSQNIRALVIDNSSGLLWLATDSGIIKYHWPTGRTERLAPENFFSSADYAYTGCYQIFRDRQGELWASFAAPGLSHILDGGRRIARFTCAVAETGIVEKPSWANVNAILCLAQDARQDSIIWAGTKAGLLRFNKSNGSIRHFYYAHPDPLVRPQVNPMKTLLAHSDGKIYIASQNGGVVIFDPATERFSHHLPHPESSIEKEFKNQVNFILPHTPTQLWVTCRDELLLFDTRTWQFTKIPGKFGVSFIDRAGNYWFFADGLTLYHRLKNQIPRLPFPDDPRFKASEILRVWEDTATQTIYVRTVGLKGLPVYDRRHQAWKLLHFPTDSSVILLGHVLEKTGDGILANDNNRFFLLPPGESRFKPFSLTVPENPGWLYSQKAPDGSVFISAYNGYLFWLKPGARDMQTFHRGDIGEPFPDHFTNLYLSAFDAKGRLWMHCYGGFSIFDPGENRFIHVPIQANRERHFEEYREFCADRQGRMWCFGAKDIGWIDPAQPEQGLQLRFGQANGIVFDNLDSRLVMDRNGRFWFKSGDNFARLDPQNLQLEFFEGFKYEQLEVLDGGELVFRNLRGLGLIHPDSLRPNTEKPRPYVAWFKVFEEERALAGDLLSPAGIQLAPDENFFSIGFSALGFFNPQKFRFAYQLVGVDKDWVYPEPGDHVASYTAVRGGGYTFRLKVANSLGVWNETIFEWRIKVGTPWWATAWFRFCLVAAVGGFIYFLVKNRLRQQQILLENQQLQFEKERSLRDERDRIAAEMHDDLGAGLSTIRFLSLLAKEKEDDPLKSGRIDKIARSAAEVMEKMADIIWVMNSRNDTLENFANYFRRYAGDYLDTHGIRFFFEIPDNMPAVSLSGEQRRTLLLALKECLHNAVKHAEATEVRLRFSLDGHLEVSIADNGKGIPKNVLEDAESRDDTRTGNGLRNLYQRMKVLGGTAAIENLQGTTVILRTGILTKKPD